MKYVELKAQLYATKAQLPCNLKSAYNNLNGIGPAKYMASGVIVSITDLNGNQIVPPFMCADGLEKATIEALQSQIKKTRNLQEIKN